MAVVCPTVTAYDMHQYRAQIEKLLPFAKRVHLDLMDGEFTPNQSPDLKDIWLPHEFICDIHLMYQNPMEHIDQLIHMKPNLVVIHNEAHVHHMDFAARLHQHDIQAGLAILQDTPIEWAHQIMHSFDHVLIFSGNLGEHGGQADLALLDKVRYLKEHHPEVEISWDGGISAENAHKLTAAGVDVLNVGGFIQKAHDPAAAYAKITSVIEG
jgi:ribulose-phosphate 3-epimerase